MDNDTLVTPPMERPRLPPADMPARDAADFDGDRQGGDRQENDRNGIFRSLVADDADIAGLVAYSIYKQNKLDWLAAFETAKGRAPSDAELASYIIGEGTPRRLATYRHLAEATLAGKGPDASGRGPTRTMLAERGALTPGAIAAYVVILVALLAGFWLAVHYTMSSR